MGSRSSVDAAVVIAAHRAFQRARKAGTNAPPPVDRVRAALPEPLGDDAFLGSIDALVDQGVLAREGDGVSVAPEHAARARALHRDESERSFDAWLVRSADSAAYQRYCGAVHGGRLQFDMLDDAQLATAMDTLALRPGDRGLDLGCALGTLTEHLARSTGSTWHGVDFARQAIARAQERTRGLSVTFEVANLDEVAPPPATYDAIVAFDSLYFVDDLPRLAAACKVALRPGGRLVAFYTVFAPPDGDRAALAVEATPWAPALREVGLDYRSTDLSASEHAYWRRCRELVDRMRGDFEAEGTLDLWESRDRETTGVLAAWDAGRARRYLYAARG